MFSTRKLTASVAAVLIALVAVPFVVLDALPAAAASCSPPQKDGIWFEVNHSYVSTETTYHGTSHNVLRSRAAKQSTTERYAYTRVGSHYAIKSVATGRYVSVEIGYQGSQYGMLRARATKVGRWELFDFVTNPYGCLIKSVANHQFVTAEVGVKGSNNAMLRAWGTRFSNDQLFLSGPPPGYHPGNGCVNPFAGRTQYLILERSDQGVDYDVRVPMPAVAICDATILGTYVPGWPGGNHFIYMRLTSGPFAGKCVYVAEHLTNIVPPGTHVRAGQQIATMLPGFPGTEWGWAQGLGTPATRFPTSNHNYAMPGGSAFARFLRSLGAPTLFDPGPGPQYAGNSC